DREFHRRTFAAKIGGIGHETALLEDVFAAGDILTPGTAGFPPGAGAVEMRTPLAHRHAGPAVGPRLHGKTVKEVTVHALAENGVAQHFERIRIFQPTTVFAGHGGEGFRADEFAAVDVADAGRQFGVHPGLADPEFTHRNIRRRAGLQ